MRTLQALQVAALLAALGAAVACSPPPSAPAAPASSSLFADPFAVEVLSEARTLAEPISPRPNRFFGGWEEKRVGERHEAGGPAVHP